MVSFEEQLKYIYNLEYIKFNYPDNYKAIKNIKSLSLYYNHCININNFPNTLIKLNIWYYDDYLNNLPLNLKFLAYKKINCNLPPNIIYLEICISDIYNLPRSLQFIYIYDDVIDNYIIIPTELIDYNYNTNNFKFFNYYYYKIIKKLKYIY